MYEDFSADYDRFVDWAGRLRFEMPFLEAQLTQAGAGTGGRVLDAACGTGQHVLALVGRGFAAAGADLSPAMIEKARQNAAQAGLWARFEAAGFGALAQTFGQYSFNALLCLGNSLPHLLSPQALQDGAGRFQPGAGAGRAADLAESQLRRGDAHSPALDGAAGVPGGRRGSGCSCASMTSRRMG